MLQEDEPDALITGEALDEWGGCIAGRVSPEGGEDSGHNGADSPDSMLQSSKTKDKVRLVLTRICRSQCHVQFVSFLNKLFKFNH